MNPAISCRAVKLLPRKRIFNSSANEGATEKTARSAIVILRIIGGSHLLCYRILGRERKGEELAGLEL